MLTVDPSADLVDGQPVAVDASGFSPEATFGVAQCGLEAAQASGIDGCDLAISALTSTDANGDVSLDLRVRRFIQVQGDTLDCAVEGACILAAATFGDDLTTPLETAFVPIAFDPDAPVLPPLEVDVVVDDATIDGVTGSISCNREAQAFVDASLFQAKAGAFVNRFGFNDVLCDETPSPFTVTFGFGSGRVTAGDVSVDVFASAFDGFEGAFDFESVETMVTGQSGLVGTEENFPGVDIEITAMDGSSTAGAAELVLTVECARPLVLTADGFVDQLVGLNGVQAGGFVDGVFCDGETEIAVPLQHQNGVVVGGPAFANASVGFFDPDTFEFDFAFRSERVVLSGRSSLPAVEPDASSRITIDSVDSEAVHGSITCEEPVMVDVFAFVAQERGRDLLGDFGSDFLTNCDGETPFTLELFGDNLRPGLAAVGVSAFAFTEDPNFIFEWSDFQSAVVRLSPNRRD